tara:strand:- start:37 stop:495 length:459 start_codon:yes stop_codon:yes gene_type:complete
MNNTFNKKKSNVNINFKKLNDDNLDLFNCTSCGFHGKVISKIWVKGYEDDVLVRLIEIHPQYFKESHVLGGNLKRDGEMVEELICGHCGRTGGKQPVSIQLLKLHCLDPEKPHIIDADVEDIPKEKFTLKKLINKILDRFANFRKVIVNELD